MTEREIRRVQKWSEKYVKDCEKRDRKWTPPAPQPQAEEPKRRNRGLMFGIAALLYFPFGVIMRLKKDYE